MYDPVNNVGFPVKSAYAPLNKDGLFNIFAGPTVAVQSAFTWPVNIVPAIWST